MVYWTPPTPLKNTKQLSKIIFLAFFICPPYTKCGEFFKEKYPVRNTLMSTHTEIVSCDEGKMSLLVLLLFLVNLHQPWASQYVAHSGIRTRVVSVESERFDHWAIPPPPPPPPRKHGSSFGAKRRVRFTEASIKVFAFIVISIVVMKRRIIYLGGLF